MSPGTVSIHLIKPEPVPSEAGWLLLSADERTRASSFVFPKHASHWIACRAALRRILGSIIRVPAGELPIVVSDLGKPALAEPFDHLHFSLSHCEDLAIVALSEDGPVGVDVEPSRRASNLADCETSFCHLRELSDLPSDLGARNERLLDLWTAKEALLKALGTGFSHPPETIRIHEGAATSDLLLPGIEDQIIRRLDHPALSRHRAAVSAPKSATRIEIHAFEASTSADSFAITTSRPEISDG